MDDYRKIVREDNEEKLNEMIKNEIQMVKQKIYWELTNNDDIEYICFMDGKVNTMTGRLDISLNAFSNLTMNLLRMGISERDLKTAFKQGLNWQRYIRNEE